MDSDRQIALEARFDAIVPTLATKADVEALRADIHKWMVGSMIGLFIGFGGLAAALAQLIKPPQPAAPVVVQAQPASQPAQALPQPQLPATIIINIPPLQK
ncbi:hypothetical protein SAMN05216319_2258 [Duganella sp. CF402]|uniref:hypothetical protein n=1 Tax=unclassified Duganella TaxID=2636909 RepID=UPI0008B27090|nr:MULTISPECIES: hypothetical protein [unclassified Duganella]RZT09317.1 hypothetical protein EV582_1362 [Duganella sp. BK701]SEL61996.1 hypothetical protein SAMN05216319_2258 [Duganella sp. CF402]